MEFLVRKRIHVGATKGVRWLSGQSALVETLYWEAKVSNAQREAYDVEAKSKSRKVPMERMRWIRMRRELVRLMWMQKKLDQLQVKLGQVKRSKDFLTEVELKSLSNSLRVNARELNCYYGESVLSSSSELTKTLFVEHDLDMILAATGAKGDADSLMNETSNIIWELQQIEFPEHDPAETEILRVETDFSGQLHVAAGLGVSISSIWSGNVLWEASTFCNSPMDSNAAEGLAIFEGLLSAQALGAKRVLVRTDSQVMEQVLSKVVSVTKTDISLIVTLLQRQLEKFSRYVVSYIPRRENSRADALAKTAVQQRLSRRGERVLEDTQTSSFTAPYPLTDQEETRILDLLSDD